MLNNFNDKNLDFVIPFYKTNRIARFFVSQRQQHVNNDKAPGCIARTRIAKFEQEDATPSRLLQTPKSPKDHSL